MPGQPPPKWKRTREIIEETDDEQDEIDQRDSKRSVTFWDTDRGQACRLWHYAVWPSQGPVRDALDRLDRMPAFERDDLLERAGCDTTRGNDG